MYIVDEGKVLRKHLKAFRKSYEDFEPSNIVYFIITLVLTANYYV
jgi:hypothetical protein